MKKNITVLLVSILIVLVLYFFYYNRSFYSNSSGEYFTIWKPLGKQSYLIKGRYISPFRPSSNYIILYSSKHIYFCENCMDGITINLGSNVIEKKGLDDFRFLSHSVFFKEYRGKSYLNGNLITDEDSKKKEGEYRIERIEL